MQVLDGEGAGEGGVAVLPYEEGGTQPGGRACRAGGLTTPGLPGPPALGAGAALASGLTGCSGLTGGTRKGLVMWAL